MATGNYGTVEWKSLINAPHWVYGALIAAEQGNIFTRRSEAKALREFLSSYKSRSPLVKEIIADQKDADDKLEGSLEDAERALRQVGTLLERKADNDEGDAVRDFLMSAGDAIAEAAREVRGRGGKPVSAKEEETLALIEKALKATPADKRRRHEAVVAAEAEKRAQEARKAEARAAAKREREEAARVEAKKKQEAEAVRLEREAEAKRLMDEAEANRKAEEARAAKEAEEAKKKQEAEAKRLMREAEAKKLMDEAEANRKAEEARAAKEAEEAKKKQEAEAAAAAATRTYVVKPGDTLSGIAKSVYGKAGRWPEIYEANKDIIKNPNLIRPGWELRIPD